MPFGAGLLVGYAVLAVISGITAVVVLITDMSAIAGGPLEKCSAKTA